MGAVVFDLGWGAAMVVASQLEGPVVADQDLDQDVDEAMSRYADGFDPAFSAVYRALEPRLMGFALRRLRSPAAAEDVVQQTFLQIIGARAAFVRGAPVLPWAYAIATRLVIDAHRRGARQARLSADDQDGPGALADRPDGGPAQDEALDSRRRERELQQDLERLPVAHREAFELTVLEGLSVAAAASVIGITEGNVKVRTHRAREALRQADARRRRSG
jgi:RNA polymerase sigma-70 factor (ECF subfamily)